MARVNTVRIRHPEDPGDFMVINASDYDSDVHELVEEAEEPAESVDDETEDDKEGEKELGLPDGYRVEHAGGPYHQLYGPDDQVIEGPSNGKWQGADVAIQAARDHAFGPEAPRG